VILIAKEKQGCGTLVINCITKRARGRLALRITREKGAIAKDAIAGFHHRPQVLSI
jgi:hypothetical protein